MNFPKVTDRNKVIIGGKIPRGFVRVAAGLHKMVMEHDIVSSDSMGVQRALMRVSVKDAEEMGWRVFRHVSKFKPFKPQPTFSKELRRHFKELQYKAKWDEKLYKRVLRLHLKFGGTK